MFLKYLCEFLGTMMLILLGDGVVANVTLNKSGMKGAGSIQITHARGLAVMVPPFIFGEALWLESDELHREALAANWTIVETVDPAQEPNPVKRARQAIGHYCPLCTPEYLRSEAAFKRRGS